MRRAFLVGLAIAAPALAETRIANKPPGEACAVPGFEAWGKRVGAPQLKLGGYSDLALAPVEAVHYAPPLHSAPRPGEKGGLYELTFSKADTYRFALGAGARVDVVGRGAVQIPIAHMRGPVCSGIDRIVDYRLQPGEYIIQISAASAPRLQMLVIGPK